MGLNAGGAEVPLSWNNIRWNTGNLLFPDKIPEKQAGRITGNYHIFYLNIIEFSIYSVLITI